MRFEVSYSSGTRHEVELAGSVAVLGRDPGCDVVLNDTKCSRRHAVVEDGPEGLVVKDAGSANGVFVNGRRVEQSALRPGDTIRIGDVRLKVLHEIGETVVVALEDEVRAPAPPPALAVPPRPEPRQPRPAPWTVPVAAAPPRAASLTRPLTVRVLSGLWALLVPVAAGSAACAAWQLGAGPLGWSAALVAWAFLSALALAMSLGLRALASWARHLQVVAATLGLLVCPLTLAAATVLLYMARSDVRRTFEPPRAGVAADGAGPAETTFALSIVAMVVVGVLLGALAALLLAPRAVR